MTAARDTSGFIADLVAERATAAEFANLLAAEQDALRDDAVERLDVLARDKLQIASRLEDLAQRRMHFLAAAGYSPDADGMKAWLAAHSQQNDALAAWQGLRRLAELARSLNQANGVLIDLRLRYCRQRLAALDHACGSPGLYGPEGRPYPPAGTRPFAAA